MSSKHDEAHQVPLIYGLNDTPSVGPSFAAALQQVLAMFVGTITPPLIIASALGLDIETKGFLVSMALMTCGVGTFIQVRRFGWIGSGLLSITGTSFGFVPLLIAAGEKGGLGLAFGLSLMAAPIQFLIAPFIARLRNVLTPLVTGTVILIIGLSLIPAAVGGIDSDMGGDAPRWASHAMAGFVLVVVLFFFSLGKDWARLGAIFYGLIAGFIVSGLLGFLGETTPVPLIAIPSPFHFGFSIEPGLLIGFAMLYLVSSMETIGDLTATSEISREPTSGPTYWNRIRGGLLADGLNSMIAAVFNAFPNTTFSQNNGVILMTGVASRRVGYYVAGLLFFLGMVPSIGQFLALMPGPVLGGTTLVLFGFISVSGIRMLSKSMVFDQRSMLVVAIAIAVAVANSSNPSIFKSLPGPFSAVFGSSVAAGGFVALLLNICLPGRNPVRESAEDTMVVSQKEVGVEAD